MHIRFRHAALISSFICGVLFFAWMFEPDQLLQLWGVGYSNSTGLVARRSAALFAGLSMMLFIARDAPAGIARSGISAGVALSCVILSLLGIYEYESGAAGVGIAMAILTEIALAIVFFRLWKYDKAI